MRADQSTRKVRWHPIKTEEMHTPGGQFPEEGGKEKQYLKYLKKQGLWDLSYQKS